MNFAEPPGEFRDRAAQQIVLSATSSGEDRRGREVASAALTGSALVHRRVFSYAEYELRIMNTVPIVGSLTKENGRRDRTPEEAARRDRGAPQASVQLRPLSSPISGLVD